MHRLISRSWLALLLVLAGVIGLIVPSVADARKNQDSPSTPIFGVVSLADLPPEARQTLSLIRRGGPFPYPHKDGSVFGNFEKRLPIQSRGYYREFTVPTPGSSDRGARRIIAGTGHTGNVATAGEYYYSPDHYRSFQRIREP